MLGFLKKIPSIRFFQLIGWKVTEQYAFARDLALIDLPKSFSPTSISIKPICLHKNSRKSELSIMEKASLGLQ